MLGREWVVVSTLMAEVLKNVALSHSAAVFGWLAVAVCASICFQ